MERNIGGANNTTLGRYNVSTKSRNHRKWTSKSSSSGGITNTPIERDSNTKLNLTKDFKAGPLAIKDQSDVQAIIYQIKHK